MNDAYSPLKVFHHQQQLQSLRAGQNVSPIHVQLIPTNRCNQSCLGCAYRMEDYPSNQNFGYNDQIPWMKLQEIVGDCRAMGVQAIEITGGGEPTIHPNFLELCELILSSGIKLGIVTNGVSLTPTHARILARASWVRFSIDAGSEETYDSYRRATPGIYEIVRNNLRDLVEARQKLGNASSLLIGVGFVVNKDNWHEVDLAARNSKTDGADNFRISALFQNEGSRYFQNFYRAACEECREAEELSCSSFHVFNLFGDRLEDLELAEPDYSFCGYSRLTTYLAADQNMYTCCMNAYNDSGFIGSFASQSFRELWESQSTRDRLSKLNASKCKRCMYNEKNKTIDYALNLTPQHVEFI